jgi:type VI secretion system protein VasD
VEHQSVSLHRQLQKLLSSASLFAVVAGCASTPRPIVPIEATVAIKASDKINPDSRGRPSPVVIRLYELKSSSSFDSADFFSLNDKDQSTLGSDFVHREEFILQPGQAQEFKRKVAGDSKTIAVVAAFRDLERSVWRAKVAIVPPVEAGRFFGPKLITQRLTVTVDDRTISIK